MHATTPRSFSEIPTPALLLDIDTLDANLRRMAQRCEALGVSLRPHAKTHKCLQVAERQAAAGARGFTVATLEEARALARAGFTDLTWAFPLIPIRLEEVVALNREAELGLTVDGPEAVDRLVAAKARFRVWLEVDCGHGRSGVDPRAAGSLELARRISEEPRLELAGILTHSGQAYRARTDDEIAAVAERERSTMAGFAERLRAAGTPVPEVSVGSTPAMTRARSLEGCTEARPGNYALYDYSQVLLGSCRLADCAATVLSTVVSRQPGAGHSVVDAGALALSKDTGPEWGPGGYGPLLAEVDGRELEPEKRVVAVSQEHGIVNGALPVGARVRILPNHSCLTVACFDFFQVVQGGEIVDTWQIHRSRS